MELSKQEMGDHPVGRKPLPYQRTNKEYHWGSALPVLKSVSTWMGDHPVGRKNYAKDILVFTLNKFFDPNYFRPYIFLP